MEVCFPYYEQKPRKLLRLSAGLSFPRILVAVLSAIVAINLWGLTKRSSNA